MQIQLTKEHEDWLRAQVAAGRFPSLEDAIAEAIDSLKSEDDDLAWAKPLVAEGLAELDRGEAIAVEQVFAAIDARIRANKDSPVRRPGRLKGKLTVPARLFEPLSEDELKLWNGGAD